MRRILLSLALALLWALPAAAATPGLLPDLFAGWQKQAGSQASSDPAQADPALASLLQEFGFQDFEQATYTQAGRTLQIRAARFADASGAYGAFTFYREPQMVPESIGTMGATAGLHVLFFQGNILVSVQVEHATAMTAAELRELASLLPKPARGAGTLPTLPLYLPAQGHIQNSTHYIEGPVALGLAQGALPAELVGFARSAEAVTGKYSTSAGTATLTVISYPTPQIAGEQLRALEAYGTQGKPDSVFQARRSGPLVALVTGQSSHSEARSLLESVNYDADVTWNQPTYLRPKDSVANLMVNVIYLIAAIFLFMLVAGIAFGGVRVLVKRLMPNRVFDRPEEMEIIRLNLR